MVFTKKLIILTTTLSLFSLTQASLDSFFSQLTLGYLPHYQSKKALRLRRSLDTLQKSSYAYKYTSAYESASRKDEHTFSNPTGSISFATGFVDQQKDAYINSLYVSDKLRAYLKTKFC